jgi:hypothetical protein
MRGRKTSDRYCRGGLRRIPEEEWGGRKEECGMRGVRRGNRGRNQNEWIEWRE